MTDIDVATERSARAGGYENGRQTRRRIVEAAVGVFGAQGYAGSSIEQIARAAGMTKGAIYAHFRRKRDLYRAALAESLSFIQVPPTADAGAGAVEQLAAFLRWLGHRLADDATARAFFLQLIHDGVEDVADDELVVELMEHSFKRLRSLIVAVNPSVDAGAFAFYIFATLLLDRELHRFHVLMVGPEAELHTVEAAVEQLVSMLAGLG